MQDLATVWSQQYVTGDQIRVHLMFYNNITDDGTQWQNWSLSHGLIGLKSLRCKYKVSQFNCGHRLLQVTAVGSTGVYRAE